MHRAEMSEPQDGSHLNTEVLARDFRDNRLVFIVLPLKNTTQDPIAAHDGREMSDEG